MRCPVAASVIGVVILSCCLTAQTATDESVAALERELNAAMRTLSDWGGLTRYGSEDTEIPPPSPNENRVVFLGDDITEQWGSDMGKFFPGKHYINRGIARQTTGKMLIRFQQDVVNLKPRVVVISGGTNDLAGFSGPATETTIGWNFESMTEVAKANGIKVVLASVTPVCNCYSDQTTRRPQGKIIGLNAWIKRYAANSGSVYLNYYSALADGRDFKKDLTSDGLHPNQAGYAVMAPLAEAAIEQALGQK
ncbi:MAG TPA: SGNH/GDSL hydrolase family protein [Bryobacteraceae bacterium]|nr:SGNH/GDSL hydrolase family protein [Bryobacteraceae bacterium]